MRRGVSDDRASKLELIKALAARRKEQEAGARPRRPIIGLSDSDDEDEGYDVAPGASGSDSDEWDGDTPDAAAPQAPEPRSFSRIRTPGGSEASQMSTNPAGSRSGGSADDLAGALSKMGLDGSASTSDAAPPSQRPPDRLPSASSTTPSTTRQHSSPPASPPPVADLSPPAKGVLALGDRGEFRLSPELSAKLYPHQIQGVTWLHGLWKVGAGGILADDMGLGKTLQTAAFLSGIVKNGLAKRAMVLAPTTLIATWEKELAGCGLGGVTAQYYGSAAERGRAFNKVAGGRGVLLTTYGMVLHNAEALAQHAQHDPDNGPLWDVLVMDEGHKLKNPKMQLRARVEALPVRQRLILSGTPIQNNLMEMWALFDLVCPGLLGDAKAFRDQFERRITQGSDKHATMGERERGAATAAALRRTVAPHMLRREKKEVFGDGDVARPASAASMADSEGSRGSEAGAEPTTGTAPGGAAESQPTGALPAAMPRKNDLVVWLRLKPNQRALYEAFLNSDSVREVLNRTRSPLASLTVLKKICDHPALLSERAERGIVAGAERAARTARGNDASSSDDEEDKGAVKEKQEDDDPIEDSEDELEEGELRPPKPTKPSKKKASSLLTAAAASQDSVDLWASWSGAGTATKLLEGIHTTGLGASCKTVFVLSLLRRLVGEGHRTLVFSQSRVMLNILEAAVRAEGWPLCRIDGGVSAAERAARVARFQTSPDIPVFLLTSQVGGLGLTLTAADRVIVVDPAWNPSVDSQSVDRAYRIGQTRDVVVYRLISCGTVEDKIYRKQVFKGGLSRTGTQDGDQFRYFSAAELRDMFRLEPSEAMESSTQKHLHALHAHQRAATPEITAHLSFLESLEGFAGVSDHDLLYSVKEVDGSGPGMEAARVTSGPMPSTYIPGSGAFAPSPTRRPRGAGAGGAGGGQEWSGGGDISAMFGKMLSIGGGGGGSGQKAEPRSYDASVAAVARTRPPLAGAEAAVGAPAPCLQRADSLRKEVAKQEALLSNPALVAGLADGGARIRSRIDEFKAELQNLEGVVGGSDVKVVEEAAAMVPAAMPVAPSLKPQGQLREEKRKVTQALALDDPASLSPYLLPVPQQQQTIKASFGGSSSSSSSSSEGMERTQSSGSDADAALQLRELKRRLFEGAQALAAAEAGGDAARAAELRQQVERLNAEYQAAKAGRAKAAAV